MKLVRILTATQAHDFRLQDNVEVYVKDGGVIVVHGRDDRGEQVEIYSRDTTIIRRAQ
jgi:hypothetical protein